jgi:hypothetical protein
MFDVSPVGPARTVDLRCTNAGFHTLHCNCSNRAYAPDDQFHPRPIKSKQLRLEVDILDLLTRVRRMEEHLKQAEDIVQELSKVNPKNFVKLEGISWLAQREYFMKEET